MQLPDEYAQQLLEQMDEKGKRWAKAKARARATEEHRKIGKSALMKMARVLGEASSREGAEVWAYTHPQYKQASDAMIAAIEDEITAETEYQNAVREWETWRSLNANDRSIR